MLVFSVRKKKDGGLIFLYISCFFLFIYLFIFFWHVLKLYRCSCMFKNEIGI
jgi:hypothetical protein